jgi:uncharacterized protein with HEPN domain
MRPDARDVGYLWDMLDAALAISDFVRGKSFRDYQGDRLLRGAVERHLEIIGEAARRVSPAFCEAHQEIPWKLIIGQRNILAHEYGEIRHDRIWNVCIERIPALIRTLESLGIATGDEKDF